MIFGAKKHFDESCTFFHFYLESNYFFRIFASGIQKEKIMCTVTLSYDQNNALARRKLAALLATGLFSQESVENSEPSEDVLNAHRQEREMFLDHSKKSMSRIIARYL